MKEQNLKTREEKLTDEEAKIIDGFNAQAKELVTRTGEELIRHDNEIARLKKELNTANSALAKYTQGFIKKYKFKNIIEFRKHDKTIIGT